MSFEIAPGTEGLIFDLDGTLADTMPFHLKAWHYACSEFGIEFSSAFLHRHTGTPAWKIAEILLKEQGVEKEVNLEDFLKVKSDGFFRIQDQVKAIEPVAEIVRRYHRVIPMAIGTGGHVEAVHRTLAIIGMKEYFDIVITANDVTNHKPDPETFLKCAMLMGVNPAKTEVFEDGDLGIEAAKRAGMIPIDVRPWYNSSW